MSLQQVRCWCRCWEEASLTLFKCTKIQEPNQEVIEKKTHIKLQHLNYNSLLANFVTFGQSQAVASSFYAKLS